MTNRLIGTSDGDDDRLRLDYGYDGDNPSHNNGNLLSQDITIWGTGGATTFSQAYSYDALNRLKTINEPPTGGWAQTYSYDRFGNRAVTGSRPDPDLSPPDTSYFDPAKNRLTSTQLPYVLYDAAGNLTRDAVNRTFAYDAENRQTAATTAGATYSYDGDSRRVKKAVGSSTTVFVYDAQGRLAAEYGPSIPPGTKYLTADPLGSTRLTTAADRSVFSRSDYLPFGEEIPVGYNDRFSVTGYNQDLGVRQRFTGKERDPESGLDYFTARYFSAPQGRFTSPDPQGINPLWLVNPQRTNRYTYGMNNPFTYVDLDGRDAIVVNFSTGALISGQRFGHNGIISVHRDGSATFADFGPINQGVAKSPGVVNTLTLPQISFGADGLPTKGSFMEISTALSKASEQPADSIGLAYFKTSEADTAMLDAWVDYTYKKSRSREGLTYNVYDQNCGHYCLTGLAIAQGRSAPPRDGFSFPNFDFWILKWLADTTYQLKATVTTSETYRKIDEMKRKKKEEEQ